MSIKYSYKENKQIILNHNNTENIVKMSKINDFAFSLNRDGDWGNIITTH